MGTKIKNKKLGNIAYIIFASIVLILILFILLNKQKQVQYSSNPIIQNVLENVNSILNKNSSKFRSSVTFSGKEYLWWDTEKSFSILNPNSPALVSRTSCKPSSQVTAVTKKLSPQIHDWFTKNGFNMNKLNSSDSYEDTKFYDYVEAFEKNNVKCTLVSNPDCGSDSEYQPIKSTFMVVCTDQFDKNKSEQEPFLQSLNIKNSVVSIKKNLVGFVYLDVRGRRGGGYIIAKEAVKGWQKVWVGQEPPDCSLVKKYNIPASIEDSCYQDNKLVPNSFF